MKCNRSARVRFLVGLRREGAALYLLYSFALGLAALMTSPYWLLKGLRERKYLASFWQRLGLSVTRSPGRPGPVWIHAVSVGEVLAARPLIRALKAARSDLPLVTSTVTLTGQLLARKELGSSSTVLYFPFDWDFCIRRFIDAIHPRAVVLMETELWPNFLKNCKQKTIPVILANGRISDRSFARYRRIRSLAAAMMRRLQAIGTQTATDRQRFIELGAWPDKVTVTGNLKFDLPAPEVDEGDPLLQDIRSALGTGSGNPVVVVGSSMKGEEPIFIHAFEEIRRRVPDAKLILAPRHPERFGEVAQLLSASGLAYRRRSTPRPETQRPCEVLLLDTIGELRRVYSLAWVAVIGGSFLPFGGHNPLEPAGLGKAIVFGPEMGNFREIARLFVEVEAALQCSAESLASAVSHLLCNEGARKRLGQKAFETFRQNQGATENTLRILLPYLI
ncbi:MAG: 3-deoxy-D-manno-octulosonic acid transferase [Acidobacteria bacterium]|nr:3-deoxy-D-manno-octulosonic acid transferase [Acidobacteriota bacterium]